MNFTILIPNKGWEWWHQADMWVLGQRICMYEGTWVRAMPKWYVTDEFLADVTDSCAGFVLQRLAENIYYTVRHNYITVDTKGRV